VILDALEFLVRERESAAGGVQVGGAELLPLLGRHLLVTAEAVAIACLVALPPALWLGHTGRAQVLAGTVANLGRALPSFAVLAVSAAYLGYSTGNLVFAMVVLAIPPIFTNAYVGIRGVDPDVVDAARGVGMAERDVLRRVELPLAVPLVLGGIRTSTVNVLATATLGPLFGVLTLGDPLLAPQVYGPEGRLGTAFAIALLAIAAELLFTALQRAVDPHPTRRTSTR
jgi:osmoprotectant transport system permease protein